MSNPGLFHIREIYTHIPASILNWGQGTPKIWGCPRSRRFPREVKFWGGPGLPPPKLRLSGDFPRKSSFGGGRDGIGWPPPKPRLSGDFPRKSSFGGGQGGHPQNLGVPTFSRISQESLGVAQGGHPQNLPARRLISMQPACLNEIVYGFVCVTTDQTSTPKKIS